MVITAEAETSLFGRNHGGRHFTLVRVLSVKCPEDVAGGAGNWWHNSPVGLEGRELGEPRVRLSFTRHVL